jgi:hypothetical protein
MSRANLIMADPSRLRSSCIVAAAARCYVQLPAASSAGIRRPRPHTRYIRRLRLPAIGTSV